MSVERARELLAALDRLEAGAKADPQAGDALLAELKALPPHEVEQAMGVVPEADEEALPTVWQNWPHNFVSRKIRRQRPKDLAELVEVVKKAIDKGRAVKPLGAGYSCSEASQPAEGAFAIDNRKLDAELPHEHLRRDVDTSHLVRVEAGIRLEALAELLDAKGLALPNMGGFARQTLAGVMSTGTHGTGLRQSTFSDMVVSVDMVCVEPSGRVGLHRFEPTGGITDPARFPKADVALHQDDDTFYAVVVACGTLGVVYAYTLAVVDRYFVHERHEPFVFPDDFDAILARAKAGEDLSICLKPQPDPADGKHHGFVTTFQRLRRDEVGADLWQTPPKRDPEQAFLGFIAAVFGTAALGAFMERFPRRVLAGIDKWVDEQLQTSFLSVYHRTYPKTTGDRFRATFNELSVPIDDLKDATARVLANAAANQHNYRFLVPFALRFVGASRHHLSMHQGRDSGTLESFMVRGMRNADQALGDIERLLPDARPHWGQLHFFPTRRPPELYPDTWQRFVAVHERWNSHGVFDSPATRKLGLRA